MAASALGRERETEVAAKVGGREVLLVPLLLLFLVRVKRESKSMLLLLF